MPSRRKRFEAQRSAAIPQVRRMTLSFAGVPRHWLGGSVLTTHRANALGLLFPAGERMFIHSVRHYLPDVTDPILRARARAFLGQECSHGREHERAFVMLEAQGYEIREWLRWYEGLASDLLTRWLPPPVQLSITVALEHLTAAVAQAALTGSRLDHAHPKMRRLLLWHAAEEIEHKSVAFDVLEEVFPGYWLRVLGMLLGGTALAVFWRSATRMLLLQEGRRSADGAMQQEGPLWGSWAERWAVLRVVATYLRPGFHPDEKMKGVP